MWYNFIFWGPISKFRWKSDGLGLKTYIQKFLSRHWKSPNKRKHISKFMGGWGRGGRQSLSSVRTGHDNAEWRVNVPDRLLNNLVNAIDRSLVLLTLSASVWVQKANFLRKIELLQHSNIGFRKCEMRTDPEPQKTFRGFC